MWEKKSYRVAGLTEDKDCTSRLWCESHAWVVDAIRGEKRIKKWLRDWKLALIERENPDWRDLAADWFPTNDPNWTPPEEPD